MRLGTLTIVGVGLIGGSIGLAARQRGLARRVLGTDRQQATLQRARELGRIDDFLLDIGEAVSQAELAVFCTPVDCVVEEVLSSARHCAPGTLLTDSGSTKGRIVRALQNQLPPGVTYLGSHPLAGSEKQGLENASATLFEGRLVVVTPAAEAAATALDKLVAFWQALGAQVRLMDPDEHDRAVAYTSHLPHLVAANLAGLLPPALYDLTAGGFRDTTRVAAGDPALWAAIFEHNRDAVLGAMNEFQQRLEHFRQALQSDTRTELLSLLTQAKKVRDVLGS
jgi:prephenate dehydrogenase